MPNRFTLRSSPILSVLLLLAHALAVACAWVLPLPWSLFLSAIILFSLSYCLLWAAWLRLPGSCVAVELDGDEATLHCRDGCSLAGKVQRDSLVSPWLIVLNVLPHGCWRSRSVLIMYDAMEREERRRLRVALRWQI